MFKNTVYIFRKPYGFIRTQSVGKERRGRERKKVREREGEVGYRVHLWTVAIDRHLPHITTTFTNCY